MVFSTGVTKVLGIEYPVIQAGVAGGATTPELVAAVSEAGGLGTFGAAYMSPDAMRDAVAEARRLTGRPFGINLFVPEAFDPSRYNPREVNAPLARYREELGIEAPEEIGEGGTGGGGRRGYGKRSSTKAVGYRRSAILTARRPVTASVG